MDPRLPPLSVRDSHAEQLCVIVVILRSEHRAKKDGQEKTGRPACLFDDGSAAAVRVC